MDKIDLVESSFDNGEQIVFYDEGQDTIWVCFGGCEVHDKHTIQFKDCSRAQIEDDQTEYYGEVDNDSYDVYFLIDEEINDMFIPTRFVEGELMEVIRQ